MRAGGVGIGLAVVSAATFGTSGVFGSALMARGWSPAAAVTMRVGIAALVLTVPAVLQLRGRAGLMRRAAPGVLAYGVMAVACAQLFFFNAVEHLSVGVALLLEYSGTLLVVLWVWFRHGHRPTPLTALGGLLAVGGLVLVLDLTGPQKVDVVGVLWGLGAATGLASYFVLSARTDAASRLPPIVMAWSGMLVGAATLLTAGLAGLAPLHASTQDADFAGTRTSWLVPAAGLSLVAAAIAYVSGIEAARRLGARLASFVGLAEVLFAILFAWVLLDQRPDLQQLIGGVVVLGGIAVVRAAERDEPTPVPAPTPEIETTVTG